ncbi:unnamed protein product [Moneuplotes crassus]|uniref:Uncharacterized protein n=1 Tax=Euplotes crassus TaxID=5936 RepID=A0AAD2D5T9_EUPCR|nr:unnamed protein product [Moneuplotes crassus]
MHENKCYFWSKTIAKTTTSKLGPTRPSPVTPLTISSMNHRVRRRHSNLETCERSPPKLGHWAPKIVLSVLVN